MELLVFGHSGAPVLVFPTSMGRYFQYEDMHMVAEVQHKIENGWLQLFCIDSVDSESWYNDSVSPGERINRHNAYDRYITDEVVPFIRSKNPDQFLITTGCSFGGYHCVNYALRHPDIVRKTIGMSGRFNMSSYLDGFHNEDVYYNVPMDYIGGLQEGEYANKLRSVEIYLVVGEWDVGTCLNETKQLAGLLAAKNIPHHLDIWGGADHDWPWWRREINSYI
jgi:esterase/lipase superfamily enzyme